MKFLIRGEKLENTASIKDYIESKLGRLEKYIKGWFFYKILVCSLEIL